MAIYNKFQDFVDQLGRAKHDFSSHTFKIYLSNAAPVATNTIKSDIAEISSGFGYTAGGQSITPTWNEVTGTATLGATDVVWTAAGGSIGPFRYVILYNDTATSPADALIAWWDYASSITLLDTETFTADFTNVFTLV